MTLSDIKKFMKKNHITYEILSKKSSIPLTTLKYIFSGATANPRLDTMQAIIKALDLEERDFDIFSIANIIPLPKTKLVPLLGTIACGTPTLAEENIDEYVKVDMKLDATFALRCKGDSMINARIFNGDIVYVHQQPEVNNGEIAVVLIDNEATLKRVYKFKDRLELRAENPTFQTLIYTEEDYCDIRILGKAIAFLSTVR